MPILPAGTSQSYNTPAGERLIVGGMTRLPSAALLLRISSGLTLLFAAGHTMGAAESWSPIGDSDVLRSMRTFEFDVSGATRTYWHFYMGFGLYISLFLLLQAVLLWLLGSLARIDPARARPFIAAVALANMLGTVIVWRFIFTLPALMSFACALCLVLALTATSPRRLARLEDDRYPAS
jgi:hypothetical protein